MPGTNYGFGSWEEKNAYEKDRSDLYSRSGKGYNSGANSMFPPDWLNTKNYGDPMGNGTTFPEAGIYGTAEQQYQSGIYRDPRYDNRTGIGVPTWANTRAGQVRYDMDPSRQHQNAARDELVRQSNLDPAAQRVGAYQLGAQNDMAAGAAMAGGNPAAARQAMGAYGQQASGIAGQTMGKAADERTRAIAMARDAAGEGMKGATGVETEAQAWAALGLQDKWNLQNQLTAYDKQHAIQELNRELAEGQVSKEEWDLIMGVLGAASSTGAAAATAASNSGSGSQSSGSNDSGYGKTAY